MSESRAPRVVMKRRGASRARIAVAVLVITSCASTPVRVSAQHAAAATSQPAAMWPGNAGDHDSLRTFGAADYSWHLTSFDGEQLTLERFRGRTLFINVWASWCAPCVAELDDIQKLHDSLRTGESADTSIAIVLITPDRRNAAERFLRRRGVTVPAYIEARRTPSAFALRALPTTYIVAPNGDIVLLRLGAAKWNTPEVRAFLRALAATAGSGT